MGVEAASEIARLRDALDRAAAATEITLLGHTEASEEHDQSSAERKELCRQLAALRDRVAAADRENEDPAALRAELGTLLFFAKTLQADADSWRSTLDGRIKELERQRIATRLQQETLVTEREKLMRRRDALQLRIVQTAAQMAQRAGGECRRTLPVVALGAGLSVCSVSVSRPRSGLRLANLWLVTLNDARNDVLVKRE